MKMSLVVDGMRSDVVAVGELGDDAVAEVAERIAAVLGRSAPARILELLSEAATELSAELPEGRVEVRLAGDDVQLSYVEDAPQIAADAENADASARITLRLSDALKARVEEGAAGRGESVNGYIVRALERATSATRTQGRRGAGTGNRLRGYGTA
jgi:predicted DNA binding CopG/RHH family protein